MPITARFEADFTKWNQALRDATATFKPLEVAAKGVNGQLAQMSKSFSGEKIIRQAELAVAALGDIKNVTKLTQKEQAVLNATLTEAIAKYRALGDKSNGPSAQMLALAKATKQSESAFSGISSALGPIKGLIAGAFAVGTITRLAGEALKFASDLNDLSAKTGISTKALQEFKFAGDQVGVTLDDVSTAVLQMQKHLVGGDKSTVQALKQIGVSFKELQSLSPEDQFVKIADALRKIEDPAVRNKTAFDLMGKAAANVLPLIATDLSKTAAEAERLGVVLDQQTIDQLDNLGDTWAKVRLAGEALIAKALVPFVPAILKILDVLGPLSRDMGKLPTDFKKLEIELLQLGVITRQAALSFIELTKWTQPLNVATGQYQKSVEAIKGEMVGLIEKVGKAQQELKEMEAPQKSVTDGAKKAAIAFGDWGDAAKTSAEKIHQGSSVIREDLSKIAAALEKVEERSDAAFEALNQAEELTALKQQLDQVANRIAKVDDAETEWILGTQHLLVNKSTVVKQYFDGLVKQQEESHKGWQQFATDLGNLSQAFAELAQISGGALSGILSTLGKLVGAANLGVKSVDTISNAMDAIGEAGGSLKKLIGGFSSLAAGILSAAAAALQFGKALFDALTHSRPEQLQSSVLHDFGVAIGEDLGKVIADSAIKEFGGSFQAAQIGNLDKIISAGGGITIQNLDKLEARLHDVFSLMQTGELNASQGQDVLNKNFQTFVDFLGGDVDPALKEIIRLNKEFGTQSKVILDYVAKNASLAAGGFNKIVQNINAIPGTLGRIGPIAQATFGALLDGGKSVIDALAEMGPGLDAVQKALKDSGQAASGFLGEIIGWQSIVENNKGVFDALSGTLDVLKGLNNAGALTQDAFASLTGTIDDAFSTLIGKGVSATDALKLMQPELQEIWELQKDFGFAVDDATQALLDQAVAEGEVGEKHRSVQEQMLDLQKQELEVLKAIGTAFGVTLPNDISKTGTAFDKLGNKIDDAIAKIPENVHVGVKFDLPELPDNFATPFSRGGLVPFLPKAFANGGMVPSEAMLKRLAPVYAAEGFFAPRGTDTVPAMLSPGEFVVNRRGVQKAGLPALQGLNQGTAQSGSIIVEVKNYFTVQAWDGDDVRRVLTRDPSIQKALGDAAMKGIERGGSAGRRFSERVRSVR